MKREFRALAVILFCCHTAVAFAGPKEDYQEAKTVCEAAKKGKKSSSPWERCLTSYNQFLQRHPSSLLADDALLAIATIRHRELGDPEKARRALEALLTRYPQGDMIPQAKVMLAQLPGGAARPASIKDEKKNEKPAAAAEESLQKPFQEPRAARRGGKAQLTKISPEARERGVTFTLEFDAPVAFTTEFISIGKRTKSPASFSVSVPHAKASPAMPKSLAHASSGIAKIDLQQRLLSGDLNVRFELQSDFQYKIKRVGKMIIVDFFHGDAGGRSSAKNTPSAVGKAKGKSVAAEPKRSFVIVVDPGHGGDDAGARGKGGRLEKDVVLAISQKLAHELGEQLGAKVYLTRSSDKSLTLEERNQFAVEKKADLFLSIHANASIDRKVAGVQTYFLNNATDEAAARLAVRENRNVGRPLPKVEHILSTMLQNATTDESRLLAQEIQRSLIGTLSKQYDGVHDLKVRSALFYVLVGAKCPGVLIETSFISNPREERRLTNSNYQQRMATAIRHGVDRFLKKRETALSAL